MAGLNRKQVSRYVKVETKWVLCECGQRGSTVEKNVIKFICWKCAQKLVEPPKILVQIRNEAEGKNKVRRLRGWHFMDEFVDVDGNVYHKGVEQPELKGTLKPTPKKETKVLTFNEKRELEKKKEQKLLKKYDRMQRAKNGGKNKKRGRPRKQ